MCLEGQGEAECGTLDENVPIGSQGGVRLGGVALSKEGCRCGQALRFQMLRPSSAPPFACLLPVDSVVELLVPSPDMWLCMAMWLLRGHV